MTNKIANEICRILSRPEDGEKIPGLGSVPFVIICAGNAREVLREAKEVLLAITKQDESHWPDENTWKQIIPNNFVTRCADEMSQEEEDVYLSRWRKMNDSKKQELESTQKWTLSNWLYWFEPENRHWYWWDAQVVDDNTIIAAVAVEECPFPSGSIDWLFRGSGALEVHSQQ